MAIGDAWADIWEDVWGSVWEGSEQAPPPTFRDQSVRGISAVLGVAGRDGSPGVRGGPLQGVRGQSGRSSIRGTSTGPEIPGV